MQTRHGYHPESHKSSQIEQQIRENTITNQLDVQQWAVNIHVLWVVDGLEWEGKRVRAGTSLCGKEKLV